MLKRLSRAEWIRVVALTVAFISSAVQANAQSTPAMPVDPQVAPHPLTQGMPVVDRLGVTVGVITAIADSDRGSMVVVKVDGKLVSIPQTTLTLDGAVVRSSQTKEQILAATVK